MKVSELYIKVREKLMERGSRSMAAVLYKKNTIYAIGYSSPITHITFANKKVAVPSMHAEMDAYKRALNEYVRIHRKKLTANLLVVRYLRTKYYANSKPCRDCIEFMKTYNGLISLRNVSYGNDIMIVTKKFDQLHTKHISRGWRR